MNARTRAFRALRHLAWHLQELLRRLLLAGVCGYVFAVAHGLGRRRLLVALCGNAGPVGKGKGGVPIVPGAKASATRLWQPRLLGMLVCVLYSLLIFYVPLLCPQAHSARETAGAFKTAPACGACARV